MNNENVRIQDDLYEAVNGEWLKTAVIPADRPTAGGFSDLDQGVEKILMADFAKFAKGEKTPDVDEVKYAVELYKKVLDTKTRNELGMKPLFKTLDLIKNLKNVDELNELASTLALDNVDLPLQFGVTADMKDARVNSFITLGPSTILPDTSYYQEGNKAGEQLLDVWTNMAREILKHSNLTEDEQALFLEDTLKFDKLVSTKVKSQLEWAEYTKNYNPMSLDELSEFVKPFDVKRLVKDLYGDKAPQTIIVYDPRAIKEMNGYFSEETFELYKHWAFVKCAVGSTAILSEELAALGKTFRRTLVGIAKDPVLEKQAYQMVSRIYAEPIGVYYGRTYFGEEAKKDIISLVKKIIATYEVRINKNTFLAPETKEKAILKLRTMVIKMGYPDNVN
jgi:putative endopeptidase